jgi:CheY-like chemotaxis protein
LLQQAGFEVTSVANTFDALNLLEEQRFDAVVLGNSFSFTERQLFAAEVGERWRTPVVVPKYADVDLELTGDEPMQATPAAAELIRTLRSLILDQEERTA